MSIDFCHLGDHYFDTDEKRYDETNIRACEDCGERERIAMHAVPKEV